MLDDIVAILILHLDSKVSDRTSTCEETHQILSVLEQLFDKWANFRQVFKNALKNSATVWMSCKSIDLALASFRDASNAVSWDAFEDSL